MKSRCEAQLKLNAKAVQRFGTGFCAWISESICLVDFGGLTSVMMMMMEQFCLIRWSQPI